ncbi:MAG: polymer-forming cytoskeletal protein [Chloroflexi bacterium]|nr:polymer-forming cytoskeletal protein [Chloroflexota bacterium]
MFRRERRLDTDQIQLTVNPNVTLRGEVICDGSVRIDGVMEEGRIKTLGNVIIGADARVMADIHADTVSIAGAFKGTIEAQRLELLAGGQVWGTVRVHSFYIDEGATLQAELIMVDDTVEDPFTSEKEAPSADS